MQYRLAQKKAKAKKLKTPTEEEIVEAGLKENKENQEPEYNSDPPLEAI